MITADLDLWYCISFPVMFMGVQHIISFALVLIQSEKWLFTHTYST